jgi:hypothetical protein
VKTQIWIAIATYVAVAIIKKGAAAEGFALHLATGSLAHAVRENAIATSA